MNIDEFIKQEKDFFDLEKQIEDQEYEELYQKKDIAFLIEKGYVLSNMNLHRIKSIFHKKILLCFKVSSNIQNKTFYENLKITNNDNIIVLP